MRGMTDRIEDNVSGRLEDVEAPAHDFDAIVRDNSGRIYNLLYQMTGNAQDSEELVQEVFYQAYKSISRFKGEASISTWLHRIAMNVACDFVRKKKRRPVVEQSMDIEEREAVGGIETKSLSAESEFMKREKLAHVRDAILKLPAKYRAPFVLNAIEGCAHEDIAKILGTSNGVARTRLHRALKMLRAELATQNIKG